MDRLYDALDAFSSCTGIPVTVYDTENRITREFNAEQKVCRLFPHFSQSEGCQGYLTFSMDESFALGEPYIFFCPAGFVEIAVPILYNGARRGCVLAGPLVLGSVDEKLLARIMELNPDDSALFPRVALFLQNAKESTPEQIQKIATLLYASVLSSRQNWEEYEHIRARSRGQISAGETVQQFKLSVSTVGETEETLWQRLLAGLHERDREAVNEAASGLFDEFLLVEAGNFDLIRMRLIELFTLLSKAALDSGINLNKILASGLDPLEALNQAQSVEELAVWTQKLIDHFFSLVPEPPAPVYSPLITQAIELIGERYAEKLTLRDVAGSIHINESYLSKLFKKELGVGFTDYLNSLRIQKSVDCVDDLMARSDFLEGYILNDLANEVLFNASNAMNRRLYNEFKAQGYHLSTRLTPGENHLSMEYQAQFLSLLTQGEPFPATLTEHYMLQPEKAMLYAYGAGTGLPDRSIDHDCSKCPNLSCYMRRDTNP